MKRMWSVGLLITVLTFGWSACATVFVTPPPPASYDMPLTTVERPADSQERWGDFTLSPSDSLGLVYTDDLLSLTVVPIRGVFVLQLENRSDHTLNILWDQAAYVGADGYSSRVVTGDTRQIFTQQSQTPTVIPRGARVIVNVIPLDLIQNERTADFVTSRLPSAEWEGKTVRLLLPFSVEGVVNEYTLNFVLRNVDISPGLTTQDTPPPTRTVLLPGAPYSVPGGALFIGRTRGSRVYRLKEGCTAWFGIPEEAAKFFWAWDAARRAGYTRVGDDACK